MQNPSVLTERIDTLTNRNYNQFSDDLPDPILVSSDHDLLQTDKIDVSFFLFCNLICRSIQLKSWSCVKGYGFFFLLYQSICHHNNLAHAWPIIWRRI